MDSFAAVLFDELVVIECADPRVRWEIIFYPTRSLSSFLTGSRYQVTVSKDEVSGYEGGSDSGV